MNTKHNLAAGLLFLAISNAQAESLTVHEEVSAAAIDQKRAAALAYWTRERIATAPAMIMIDTGKPGVMKKKDTNALSVEVPTSTKGGLPASGSNALHREAYPEDWQRLDEEFGALYIAAEDLLQATGGNFSDIQAGTASTYINYDVNTNNALWKIVPHRWIGKFTFTTPSGNASCSATAISNNHILTAAHCVYDTSSRNAFYTNKAFTPAYRNGSAPYGTFPTTGCRVLTAWVNLSGNYSISTWARHDVAVCNAGTNSAGQTLNNAVGWAGRSWDFPYEQVHFNAGYPARDVTDAFLPDPAQYLRACTAESFQQTTDTLGSGCFYGRGISGGPWLRNYAPFKVQGNVNSVNSGLFIGAHNLYGVRFTSSNIKVLCDAEGC